MWHRRQTCVDRWPVRQNTEQLCNMYVGRKYDPRGPIRDCFWLAGPPAIARVYGQTSVCPDGPFPPWAALGGDAESFPIWSEQHKNFSFSISWYWKTFGATFPRPMDFCGMTAQVDEDMNHLDKNAPEDCGAQPSLNASLAISHHNC